MKHVRAIIISLLLLLLLLNIFNIYFFFAKKNFTVATCRCKLMEFLFVCV